MDAYRSTHNTSLTRLYTDAKRSSQAIASVPDANLAPEAQALLKEFNNQKDRLIAWGLEWSDNAAEGDIDESVQRAGLTEVVSTVLENIKDLIDGVEKIRDRSAPRSPAGYPVEKSGGLQRMQTSDFTQFGQLITELTSAIDLLCDLSGSQNTKNPDSKRGTDFKDPSLFQDPRQENNPIETPSFEDLKVDISDLILPDEELPPYDSFGVPCSPRIIGHLRRPTVSSTTAKGKAAMFEQTQPQPVFIEYANYDSIYRNTGVPLPFSRLEHVYNVLRTSQAGAVRSLVKLIGYFEDPNAPRYGLIYELPSEPAQAQSESSAPLVRPTSLLTLLQTSSKLHSNPTASASLYLPSLEARFRLALEVASGLDYLQEHSLTHRDMNSNSIMFFSKTSQASVPSSTPGGIYNVRSPVICSFDVFSEFDIERAPENLHQNIYRHPDDPRIKGPNSSEVYRREFDLYSLGLVLLEIGLWIPLANVFKEKYSLQDFKTRIERLWTKRLASKCGSNYMRAVQDCLGMGSDPRPDENLGAIYGRVLGRLQRCCLLDDDEFMSGMPEPGPALLTMPAPVSPELTRKPSSNPKPRRFRFPDRKLPPEVLKEWEASGDRLAKIVGRALRSSKETMSINMTYTGETETTAKPTFEIECTSTKLVKSIVRKKFYYNPEVYDLVVTRGRIIRSKLSAPATPRRSGADPVLESNRRAANPFYHPRPLCGASIGAWRDNEHLPPVSFGGVVSVDGELYGMTVHHLLEDPVYDVKPTRSSAQRESTTTTMASAMKPIDSDHPFEIYEDSDDDTDSDFDPTGQSDSFSDVEDFSDYEQSDDEEELKEGDTAGIRLGDGDDIIITQPALSDVNEDFFPSFDDRDEDHIDSHSLGHVHASSGLKRANVNGVEHEIDWALMKLMDNRLQPHNVIAGGKRYCHNESSLPKPKLRDPVCRAKYSEREDLIPRSIVVPSDGLRNLNVHCFGRTSGLECGRISQTMSHVRFPGRSTFSKSWTVAGNFGVGGDSGAWVIDNDQGRICGHVLAWSASLRRAYIAPMDVIFEDMKRVLGAKQIVLPEKPQEPSTDAKVENISLTTLNIEEPTKPRISSTVRISNPSPGIGRDWASQQPEQLAELAG